MLSKKLSKMEHEIHQNVFCAGLGELLVPFYSKLLLLWLFVCEADLEIVMLFVRLSVS